MDNSLINPEVFHDTIVVKERVRQVEHLLHNYGQYRELYRELLGNGLNPDVAWLRSALEELETVLSTNQQCLEMILPADEFTQGFAQAEMIISRIEDRLRSHIVKTISKAKTSVHAISYIDCLKVRKLAYSNLSLRVSQACH